MKKKTLKSIVDGCEGEELSKVKDSKICLHTGEYRESYLGAIALPIIQTSLFTLESRDEFLEEITAVREQYVYT